jgi:hypothetical protein
MLVNWLYSLNYLIARHRGRGLMLLEVRPEIEGIAASVAIAYY